jgi:hypothetical protein
MHLASYICLEIFRPSNQSEIAFIQSPNIYWHPNSNFLRIKPKAQFLLALHIHQKAKFSLAFLKPNHHWHPRSPIFSGTHQSPIFIHWHSPRNPIFIGTHLSPITIGINKAQYSLASSKTQYPLAFHKAQYPLASSKAQFSLALV